MTTRVETTVPDADVRVVVTVGSSVTQAEREALDRAISDAVVQVLDGKLQ